MIQISLKEICEAFGAPCPAGNVMVSDVTTDSRKITKDCLFVALKGERFDGHDFAIKAIEEGACASVVCESFEGEGNLIRVPDTLTALGKIASLVRGEFSIPVVGVTGSVGKTTSKEMIACALSPLGKVCKTKLNYNNEIGLPMTVFSVAADDLALVGEMGMRGLGEIEYLTKILRPDVGLITNIGVSHIERLGSQENIMKAKTEICYGLSEGAALLCGAEDYDKDALKARIDSFGKNIKLKMFGLNPDSDYYAKDVSVDSKGNATFKFMPKNIEVTLSVPGEHNVRNAVGALAVACEFGISAEDAAAKVAAFEGDKVRQNIVSLDGDRIAMIDDTYNAGPESMIASLKVLSILAGETKIAYLGSMLELGSASEKAHADVYAFAKTVCDEVYTVGKEWANGGDFEDSEKAAEAACKHCSCGSIAVLVKGSHAMEMNKITETLKNKFGEEK